MKRILEMFGEPISYGGQESVVLNMLSVFDLKNEFNVYLYTPYFADNKDLIELVEKNSGKVYTSGVEFKTGDNRFKLASIVEKFFTEPAGQGWDVAHIHTGSLTTMVVYARFAKKYGVKKVIVHSHIANRNQGLLFKIRRYILCLMLKPYVDVYMGCSKDAIDSKFKPINAEKVVINNGIDVDRFKFNADYRDEIRSEFGICDKYVIGSLGRISHQKNNRFMIDVLFEVIKAGVKDIALVMVGDGGDLDAVKEYAKDKGVLDYVIFTGKQTETYKYYSAFDLFILPSLYEGLPVTSIEAQVSGLPALLSDKMPRDCNIAKTTEFLDITDAKKWTRRITDIKEEFVNNRNTDIDFDKFDRRLTYGKVADIYRQD